MIRHLEALPVSEVIRYDTTKRYLKETVCFAGTPRKHPYDREKLILITSPFNANTWFFEFRINDIMHAEDQPSIVTESGENIRMVNLWIKKGSFALKIHAFEVNENFVFPEREFIGASK